MMRLFTLVLFTAAGVFCAAAAAPPVAVGPRLSDAQFFSLLDFSRPDLAGVQKSVVQSDWPAARHALAEYMRTRPWPHWNIEPRAMDRTAQTNEPEADNALAHLIDNLGITWQFGEKIDWAFNPTTQPDSKWPRNHEWTWGLNRHFQWPALARAFYATGD